jgi:Rps23 Pro-64 3,4-dihydroxylase Tpa1-like proline 4-hydroxylase
MTVEARTIPFPHTSGDWALPSADADRALDWMRTEAPWCLRVASFYEQWELSLDSGVLPPDLRHLSGPGFVHSLAERFLAPLTSGAPDLVEITAHKLARGQTIRIHNDFIEGQETHRVLIQLNEGWRDNQGGMLLLFASASSEDVKRIVRPLHGSGFGFEISPRSFHAVSTIHDGERFTLVYSFNAQSGCP